MNGRLPVLQEEIFHRVLVSHLELPVRSYRKNRDLAIREIDLDQFAVDSLPVRHLVQLIDGRQLGLHGFNERRKNIAAWLGDLALQLVSLLNLSGDPCPALTLPLHLNRLDETCAAHFFRDFWGQLPSLSGAGTRGTLSGGLVFAWFSHDA